MLVLAVVSLIAGLTFRDYGLGWDDYTHAEYADLLLRAVWHRFYGYRRAVVCQSLWAGYGSTWRPHCCTKSFRSNCLRPAAPARRRAVGAIGPAVTWRLARRRRSVWPDSRRRSSWRCVRTFYGHMFMNPGRTTPAVSMVILILALGPPRRGVSSLAANHSDRDFGAGLSIGCRVLGGLALVYAVQVVPLLIEEFRQAGTPREAAHRFAHGSRRGCLRPRFSAISSAGPVAAVWSIMERAIRSRR
jgi:hypothetical protein